MRHIWQRSLLSIVLVAGIPAWADDAQTKNPDPYEHFNRKVYRFNDAADRYAVKPAAKAYRNVTPQFVRDGISNFFDNLSDPLTALNQVMQGKFKNAASDTGRFLVNSTVGVLGLFDVASKIPLPHHKEDFGQTLGVWGVGPGPYLMLPFLGPSTVRDLSGRGVDTVINPRRYFMKTKTDILLLAAEGLNTRAELIPVEGIVQGDKYLFIRDLYLQKREFDIHDGNVSDPFLDDNDDSDSSGGAAKPAAGADDPFADGKGSTAAPATAKPAEGKAEEQGGESKAQAPAQAPADPFLDSSQTPEKSSPDSKPTK